MIFFRSNEAQDDFSDGSEIEDLFVVNAAVNLDANAGVEAIISKGGNVPALPSVPIPRNVGIYQGLPWSGGHGIIH